MISFTIHEQIVEEDSQCILNKKYHVVEQESGAVWFASDILEECNNYIHFHTTE
jgi:hypothetical protein